MDPDQKEKSGLLAGLLYQMMDASWLNILFTVRGGLGLFRCVVKCAILLAQPG